jgi:hypothetical protein
MNSACCVMISVPQRAQVRQHTLGQLQQFGFEAQVFARSDLPLGARNHRAVVVDALRFGLDSNHPYILFLEDDLDFAAHFPAAVAESVRSGAPVVTLYCAGYRFYPPKLKRALKHGQPYESGLYPVANRRRFFGSQALLMSRSFVEHVLMGWRWGYLDNRVGWVAPPSMMLYAPNPVQHYGVNLQRVCKVLSLPHTSHSFRPTNAVQRGGICEIETTR